MKHRQTEHFSCKPRMYGGDRGKGCINLFSEGQFMHLIQCLIRISHYCMHEALTMAAFNKQIPVQNTSSIDSVGSCGHNLCHLMIFFLQKHDQGHLAKCVYRASSDGWKCDLKEREIWLLPPTRYN